MSVLSFRDVWVEYGDKVVLEKVSLDVAEGSFVSIVGPSGAGKSTFLRLTLGQEAPTRGQVLLDGKPLRPEPGPDRGVVFQRYSVFPHLTALDNVVFGLECERAPFTGRLFGAAHKAAQEEAAQMLTHVGLGDALKVFPAQLSGGMQQRLAIAQALPRLIESLRLNLCPAWVYLISAEAIASDVGLGYRIFLVRRYLAMDIILPYVAWISLLAVAMDVGLSFLSRRAFPWAHPARGR